MAPVRETEHCKVPIVQTDLGRVLFYLFLNWVERYKIGTLARRRNLDTQTLL
jgi:hypothetical protein